MHARAKDTWGQGIVRDGVRGVLGLGLFKEGPGEASLRMSETSLAEGREEPCGPVMTENPRWRERAAQRF